MEKIYIELEEAIAVAMDYDGDGNAQDASQDIASALGAIPAADVRPVVHGEWKNAHPSSPMLDGGGPPYCSVCGEEAPMRSVEKNQWKLVGGRISGPEVVYSEETYLSNFCPNCGADMREINAGNSNTAELR